MMLFVKRIIPFVIVLVSVSQSAAQEEQWTEYLGKSFDSVVSVLHTTTLVDTHSITTPRPMVVASVMPYEFLGEKGILLLRRSDNGKVKACTWMRGVSPVFKEVMDKTAGSTLAELALQRGDLDRIFNTVWNHFSQKLGYTYASTDEGGYLWRENQVKKKNVEYTMTRTGNYIEFTVIQNDSKSGKSKPSKLSAKKN